LLALLNFKFSPLILPSTNSQTFIKGKERKGKERKGKEGRKESRKGELHREQLQVFFYVLILLKKEEKE